MTQAYQPQEDTGLSLRKITHIIYGLFALGILSAGVFGVAALAAVVLAYLKRGDAAGTVYAAHFDWVLTTFCGLAGLSHYQRVAGAIWVASTRCQLLVLQAQSIDSQYEGATPM